MAYSTNSVSPVSFASYFHPETCATVKPRAGLEFMGQSLPYFDSIRARLRAELGSSELPLNSVPIDEFRSVHTCAYLESLLSLSRDEECERPLLSLECRNLYYAMPGYEFGLGGAYSCLDLMRKGILDRAYCFNLPSHHAFPDKGHGYCILNSMAAAARYAQRLGYGRILIVDWDIHHGDGTQTIFEHDPTVHCLSLHSAVDLYMSLVKSTELGTTTYGEKVGHCNIPVLDRCFTEAFYYDELKLEGRFYRAETCLGQLEKELESLPFSPDLILVFDGHDSHIRDCGKDVTDFEYEDFRKMASLVKRASSRNNSPILSFLGGGYIGEITVKAALVHIEELKRR